MLLRIVWYAILVIITQVTGKQIFVPSDGVEFCQWEVFEASCPSVDEVVMVSSGVYGRSRLGRCIQNDYGHLDCGTDVTDRLARQCSARRRCSVAVTSLHGNHRCPMDIAGQLIVKYSCVSVTRCHRSNICQKSLEVVDIPASGGYLSSVVTSEGLCGSATCPWRLQVEPGQRINLTLLDFSALPVEKPPATSVDNRMICPRYASVREGSSFKDLTQCEKTELTTQPRHVYISEGGSIQIIVYADANSGMHFLLRYEAVSCPTLKAPAHAKVTQLKEETVVECLRTEQRWTMRCVGSTWVGQLGVCSDVTPSRGNPASGIDASDNTGSVDKSKSSTYGMLMVVGLGIAIGVLVGFTLLVVVLCCIRRNSRQRSTGQPSRQQSQQSTGGSPVYWKSSNGLIYKDDIYNNSCELQQSTLIPGMHHEHDYIGSLYAKHQQQTTSLPVTTTAIVTPTSGLQSARRWTHAPPPPAVLPDCLRTGSCATGAAILRQEATLRSPPEHRRCQNQVLQQHLYELPAFDETLESIALTSVDRVHTQ